MGEQCEGNGDGKCMAGRQHHMQSWVVPSCINWTAGGAKYILFSFFSGGGEEEMMCAQCEGDGH